MKKISNKPRVDFNSCSVYTFTYSCNKFYIRTNGGCVIILYNKHMIEIKNKKSFSKTIFAK